ncbi:hypothetical protein [Treponema sp.]|uniref:tetratricopeptide repeat protein n=1 Tax=Treponema sp. TaxID=166 RepID=UPI00298E7EA7|nr:hypothetical protein [Treponema sp.]MCR5613088.1 hypothetical protein [Treponema sp.]
MKKIVCFVLSLFCILNVYADNSSSAAANRKTALRYLQIAKTYVPQNDWASVKNLCESGMQYDDKIADLYYLSALSLFNLDSPRYQIIPVIQKALSGTEWVDYNMTNARVFYADMLCSTGRPEEALKVLDSEPLIYSSDAEYVRIKSLYQMNKPETILRAEEKIDSARRVYPKDVRFFYLFFNYEYNLLYVERTDGKGLDKRDLSPLAKKIAASFIAHVPDYDKSYKDLEILASFFAEGESQRRLLKAFDARGFNHILYPIAALEAGIISEEAALDYFLKFIDGPIETKILVQLYSMIKEPSVKKYFDENLDAFKGTLIYDVNNTLEENLSVKYERGRAQKIIYDYNNDQNIEWEVTCDFGEPKSIFVYDEAALVKYGSYPNVNSIVFEDVEPGVKGQTIFNIIDETFVSKPFDIIKAPQVDTTDFYVVDSSTLVYGNKLFDADKILESANLMNKPSLERPGARIEFSILNGKPYKARYYTGSQNYAEAQFFDDTICVIRSIDKDGDGIFEATEYYQTDDRSEMQLSKEDIAAVTTNIWGSPVMDAPLYLKKIQIDTNVDTVFDFSETYLPRGGKITEWDSDFDGQFDVRFHRLPKKDGAPVTEENWYSILGEKNEKKWVVIIVKDGVPVAIADDVTEFTLTEIIKGKEENFFWIGKSENVGYEKNILGQIHLYQQGQVFQMEEADCYIKVIKIGKNIYAKKIIKEEISENSLTGDHLQNDSKNN